MKKKPLPWTPNDIPDLSNQTVIVTGANSGLGLESARMLSSHGATVVMACRDLNKGKAAMEDIRGDHPEAKLELMALDLADLASVRQFTDTFKQHYDRLDILINNAGVMAPPLQHTKDGFEMQFGTNHLGHFALTGLLLETLEAAEAPRVVVVSSLAHRMGNLYFDNLNGKKGYQRWKFYGQSKLANLMFSLELDRRLRGGNSSIQVMAAHPGYAATNLQRGIPGHKLFNAVTAQSQEKGALPSVFAATSELAQSGHYYGPNGFMEFWGVPAEAHIRRLARNEKVASRLWEVSAQLTGVSYL
ncbi:MAG: SDR family NAD(P)-dependent oxidoreductase [Halomonadaceae bacterium]|nr:MAG: SDR family NAD(P)-dependent oxidoreductase [Halomonadaceae bacterium]